MNRITRHSALLLGLGTGLMLTACSAPEETADTDVASAYTTVLDIKDVMNYVLEPAADILWASGGWVMDASGYEELYPTTEEGWDFVHADSAVIVEAGNMLALPGRAVDNDAWMVYSKGLSDAGILAMEAAAARDKEAFFQAGAQLYSVCTACHQAYNPDIVSRFSE